MLKSFTKAVILNAQSFLNAPVTEEGRTGFRDASEGNALRWLHFLVISSGRGWKQN